MKQRDIFTKIRKEAPADEVSNSAKLLIRAGFINKEMAGVYDILPLGLRVMRKIENIIRDEMNTVGGQEVEMTALQDPNLWKKTDRWDDAKIENWFKTELKNGTELGLAFTHEEAITNMMKNHISSYKDLPKYVYQFQTKFRNELRAKSGIMRGREFLMKDLYSFSLTQEQHDAFYEKMKEAYLNVYRRVGLGDRTYITFASGGVFAKYSHEFQTLTDVGEDLIYLDEAKKLAINKEVLLPEVLEELGVKQENLKELKAIEVGNIFNLGVKYSKPLELIVDDKDGKRVTVIMGSYGMGLGRLMGTVAEVYGNEKGLLWPETIAPFKYHLMNLLNDTNVADELYEKMQSANVEVLYDNRDLRAGEKLAESDLIGLPYRIVIGKNFTEKKEIEIQNRHTGAIQNISIEKFVETLK